MSKATFRDAAHALRMAAILATSVCLGGAAVAPAPVRGVLPGAVVVGTHLDLSGPLSELGHAVRNGIATAFDEANAAGGVHGRRLQLVAADDGYSARRAVAVTRRLLGADHVFAILCPVGTPPVARTMGLVLGSGTLHLFPFTSADDTYVPLQPLEFAADLRQESQIAIGVRALLDARGPLKVGVLYRDDAFGEAVRKGAEAELARRGLHPVAEASFEPLSTNFMAALANLRNAGSELLVIGGVAQEAIAALQQAASRGWFPVSLCSQACYVAELPVLGGREVSGLYVVATTPIPYPDDRNPKLRLWVRRYEQRFGTVASVEAFRAYLDARAFAEALRRAGPDPTGARVAHALETMSPWSDPVYGGVPLVFTAHDHVGFHSGFLARVRNGRWATLTGPLRH